MKKLSIVIALLIAMTTLAPVIHRSQAQNIAGFQCLVSAPNSCSGSLRANTTTGLLLASVAGYRFAGDGGSGDFLDLGAASSKCVGYSGTATLNGTTSVTLTLGSSPTTGMRVGELVSGTGVPLGAEISSITNGTTITITLAATSTQSTTLTISGDNAGTLIIDSEPTMNGPGPQCWQKTNYRGDPHEFGAYGDGVPTVNPPTGHDDTQALQYWLGAYGNVSNLTNLPVSTTPPSNFGPWIATIPANYYVSGPLTCPPNAVLQGFANDTSGISKSQGSGSPTVQIFAGTNFQVAGTAVLTLGPFCRISGITVDAKNMSGTTGRLNAIDVAGTHAVIDGHSLARNGNYNVNCPAAGAPNIDGLQIKDSQFETSFDAGIVIGGACQNVRLIGDIVENSGQDNLTTGYGVSFSSSDITIANGIIEGSAGANLFANGAQYAIVSNMTFSAGSSAATGTGTQAPSVEIQNSTDITLTANRYQGGGSDNTLNGNSDILFSGTLDNITLDGNVYSAKSRDTDANIFPSFIYDVVTSPSAPTLTNVHFYETPEIAPGGVFASAIAQALLQPLQIPQFTNNQLGGLTMFNDLNPQIVDIAPGSAADSSNSTLITLPPLATSNAACKVNLTQNGLGGLDTGTVAMSTTYFIYVIAAAPGGTSSTPSCIASTSPLAPYFFDTTHSFSVGDGYLIKVEGGTFQGGTTVYNVVTLAGAANPLAGVIAGDAIMSTDQTALPATTIAGFSANAQPSPQPTGVLQRNSQTVGSVSNTTNVYVGMAIVDQGTSHCILAKTYVTQVTPTFTISNAATCDYGMNVSTQLSISGARQLVLAGPAHATQSQPNLYIATGYYRLIGALFTDANKDVVKFKQNGDTFYLNAPGADIPGTSLGTTPLHLALASVPSGISVEAFGRCVTGSSMTSQNVLLYSPLTSPAAPSNFATSPGYSIQTSTATPSFGFRLYTDTATGIEGVSSAAAATLQCETDGWVFHRSQ